MPDFNQFRLAVYLVTGFRCSEIPSSCQEVLREFLNCFISIWQLAVNNYLILVLIVIKRNHFL